MPNPISSAVQDMVTSTITSKILGGNKKSDDTNNQHNKFGGAGGGFLGKISSTIASAVNSTTNQQQPNHSHQMSYNDQSYYGGGGGGYPQQQQQYNTGTGGSSVPPPQHSVYPPQPQGAYGSSGAHNGGYYPPYGGSTMGDYPPQQAPYPTPTPAGYPPAAPPPGDAPIGFNIGMTSTTGTAGGGSYPLYQPNLGGGAPMAPSYPQQQQQQSPYPPSSGGYPTQPYSTQPQQTATLCGGASGGLSYSPQLQQQQQYQQPMGTISPPAQAMSTPSIRPNPNFNAQTTAELLRKAMKGFGCDRGKVIQALVNCSNAQRQEVNRSFKQMYGKDLIHELKSELSGDFEDLIMALMEVPAVYDAAQLRRSMQGLGTKEHVLIEIMTTRTNAQIHAIKMAYRKMYNADLERDIVGETSGYFQRLLISLCSGSRDEQMRTDPIRANQDAQRLWRAGEARLGTDEIAFNSILAAQNFAQLRLVFDEYQRQHGHSIEQAIANEFSGDIRDANLALVKSIRNRGAYFAELLHNSMKGFGTRDTDLIRLVVTRSEVDLADTRQAYQNMYGTSMENAIANDCSGAYKDGLIAVVKGHYH